MKRIFGRLGSEEVKTVADAHEFELVLAQVDLVDLDHRQRVGHPRRIADEQSLFVEVESFVDIFAAQVERLPDELRLEIVFRDGVDFSRRHGLGRMGRGRRGVRGGRTGWRLSRETRPNARTNGPIAISAG